MIPAPIDAAHPTRKAAHVLRVATAAANTGAKLIQIHPSGLLNLVARSEARNQPAAGLDLFIFFHFWTELLPR